jgi:hypothetical protein
MYLHHITAISSFYAALIVNKGVVALPNIFTEISTPFMHYRQFLFIHKKSDSFLMVINSIFFFCSFTFLRVVIQIYFIYAIFFGMLNKFIFIVRIY